MSTIEEPEATTDAVDVAADLLPTGTVEQAVAVVDEMPEGAKNIAAVFRNPVTV